MNTSKEYTHVNNDKVQQEEGETVSNNQDPHATLVDHVRTDQGKNREALAYLLRYESMVRQQEAEDMATLAHLQPCLERLMELVQSNSNNGSFEQEKKNPQEAEEDNLWKKEISHKQLRQALQILEPQQQQQGPTEFMTTDRQLMMILRLLAQSSVDHRRIANATAENATLTWAEIVQCYKACILGMTTLQHFPKGDTTRQRVRDRTLAMLALFEPQTRLWSTTSSSSLTATAASNRRSINASSALHSNPRSSFTPAPLAVKRRRKNRVRVLLVGMSLLLVFLSLYCNMELIGLSSPSSSPSAEPWARSNSSQPKASSKSVPPNLAIRSLVQSTMPGSISNSNDRTIPTTVTEFYDEEEDMGVTGPAILVGTVGTPVVVLVAQKIMQHVGTGAAFVASTATLSTYGSVMVTVAGFVSLGSLLYRSMRAVFQGLSRLRKTRDETDL
jgi:hypothetical protein